MFDVIFGFAYIFVFGTIIYFSIRGIHEWYQNNQSPIVTIHALVISKRMNTSVHIHDMHHHRSTIYYITFEIQSGERLEFHVNGKEYGIIIEGDVGVLSYQRTRFLGFEHVQEKMWKKMKMSSKKPWHLFLCVLN